MAGRDDLRIDYDAMEDSADKLMSEKETFDGCVSAMDRLIHALPDIWEGKASEKYIEQFEDLEESFEATSTLIEDLATQMRKIVKAMQDSDDAIARQIGINK